MRSYPDWYDTCLTEPRKGLGEEMKRCGDMARRALGVASFVIAATGCGGQVEGTSSDPNAAPPIATFSFPEDGEPNNNGYVGPFCCTGQTAIFKDDLGAPIGYAYFYSFDGGINLGEQQSAAKVLQILVAGRTKLDDPNDFYTSEVAFDADELQAGATKSTTAGALVFDVVIDHADLLVRSEQTYFDMATIATRVSARYAEAP